MNIRLSDHFSFKKLIRFTISSVIMMIFTSIYGVVDGIFVSNFVGKTEFAAVNFILPICMICGSIGFMIGTGGSALVSMTLGQQNPKKANEIFSFLIYTSVVFGLILSAVGVIFIEPILSAMGAEGGMLESCIAYGRILIPASTAFILQNEFQSFLVTAEKPKLGLFITVAAGVTNIVLDALFIIVFKWGIIGAAAATATSQLVGCLIPLIYFAFAKKGTLRLGKTRFMGKELFKTCVNGSSEMMTNLSMSTVNMLYNIQLMKIAGENGVAAFGVIMYVAFIFVSVFIGFSIGSAPVISYHYGADNSDELKSLSKKSIIIVAGFAIIMTFLAEALALPLSQIFVGYDSTLMEMTKKGFMIYSVSFIFVGFNIFGSAFFTALNNGIISAIISFVRTFLFQFIAIMTLPLLFGINGVWFSVTAAELLSLVLTAVLFLKMRKRYKY